MSNQTRCLGLFCGSVLLLAACFASHGPKDGTETGNPPVINIDSGRVALKVSASAVHITGDKGAVTPGGTAIEITNITTGTVTKTKVSADGSFDVPVNGSPNDAFVVRTSTGQGAMSAAPVYVVRGSAAVGSGTDGSLSCEQRGSLARAAFDRALADADKSCQSDMDCRAADDAMGCSNGCPGVIVSETGAQELAAASAAIHDGLCANYASDGCPVLLVSCAVEPTTACVAGQCVNPAAAPLSCEQRVQMANDQLAQAVQAADTHCLIDSDCTSVSTLTACSSGCDNDVIVSKIGAASIENAVSSANTGVCADFITAHCPLPSVMCPDFGPLPQPKCMSGKVACSSDTPLPCQCTRSIPPLSPASCTTCFSETLTWGPNGGIVAYIDQSTITPCVHYTHSRTPVQGSKTLPLSCERDFTACNAIAGSGAIMSALSNADVEQALAKSPVLYGYDSRPVDGTVFEIKVGTRVIDVGAACGTQTDCVPVPSGVQALVDLLQAIDKGELTLPACQGFGS